MKLRLRVFLTDGTKLVSRLSDDDYTQEQVEEFEDILLQVVGNAGTDKSGYIQLDNENGDNVVIPAGRVNYVIIERFGSDNESR